MIKPARKKQLLGEANRLVQCGNVNGNGTDGVLSKILNVAISQGRDGVRCIVQPSTRLPYYGKNEMQNWKTMRKPVENLLTRLRNDDELKYVIGWARRIAYQGRNSGNGRR